MLSNLWTYYLFLRFTSDWAVIVFQELLKLVVNCVTSSDVAEDLHLAGSMTGKLAVELLHVRFSLCISLKNLQEFDWPWI